MFLVYGLQHFLSFEHDKVFDLLRVLIRADLRTIQPSKTTTFYLWAIEFHAVLLINIKTWRQRYFQMTYLSLELFLLILLLNYRGNEI